jgi:hypothetical protein
MVDATPVRGWLVAQTRRRIVRLTLDQAYWPAGDPHALLRLSHPQTHPGMTSTT